MGISQEGAKGWLNLIRFNRLGLQYSRNRYYVLHGNTLDCYKGIPRSNGEDPLESTQIGSSVRVANNGKEIVHNNAVFVFTLYNVYDNCDEIKLGAKSSEEATMWIRSFSAATLKDFQDKGDNLAAYSNKRTQTLRMSHSKSRGCIHSIDWTVLGSSRGDPMASDASDISASSQWAIFGCSNGLRLFKEVMNGDLHEKDLLHPAIMAVGVVDASSEAIFRTLMSLGPSRSEWDFCLSNGCVIEQLNDQTDIIHKKLHGNWLPRGMSKRDLLLQRYWRRQDDGSYVIGYHSVFHPECPLDRGYIRATLKSGGYIISPVNQGKQSVVKHMLAIDWKSWRSYLFASSGEYITIKMLARIAALREFFITKPGSAATSDCSSVEVTREIGLFPQSEKEDIKVMQSHRENTISKNENFASSLHMDESNPQPCDPNDEFFDVPVEYEYDQSEFMWPSGELQSLDQCDTKLSTTSIAVKRMQDPVPKSEYVDFKVTPIEDMARCAYGTTLAKDQNCNMLCSWSTADPSNFYIRGESYHQDHRKIQAESTLMEMVGADWIKSNKREDDLGGRPGGIVQKHARQGSSKFFFIVNMQLPGPSTYSLAFYYMMDSPLENCPLLEKFVKGDEKFRNSRFKLIPSVTKGSWIVKQSVGKKACLVGEALTLNYFQGKNYLEIDVDIGTSKVARSIASLILSYLSSLVIELAFLIQGNTQEELPEVLLGTCCLNHMDASKSVPID